MDRVLCDPAIARSARFPPNCPTIHSWFFLTCPVKGIQFQYPFADIWLSRLEKRGVSRTSAGWFCRSYFS